MQVQVLFWALINLINNIMYKKCKVVMLPTNEKSKLFIGNVLGQLQTLVIAHKDKSTNNQHLYILSDDEIKKSDFTHVDLLDIDAGEKKIIATTDSLTTDWMKCSEPLIPSIPQSFIDKYVSEYNKGNKIEEVMVEYKNTPIAIHNEIIGSECLLKLNPDNTINIQSIKDSWTKREVVQLFIKYNLENKDHLLDKNLFKWLKENL